MASAVNAVISYGSGLMGNKTAVCDAS